MKKSMQFLLAMCIFSIGQNSYAGVNPELPASLDKPVVSAPLISPMGNMQVLVIIVYDEFQKPLQGAMVHAPCTGQDPIASNSSGVAQFSWIGTCNCDGTKAEITTPDCDAYIPLKCGVVNQANCKP